MSELHDLVEQNRLWKQIGDDLEEVTQNYAKSERNLRICTKIIYLTATLAFAIPIMIHLLVG